MNTEDIITSFANKVAPPILPGTNIQTRHTLTTLSRFLNVPPAEVVELCNAKLLVAAEAWPGAPSLSFSNHHLYELRRRIAETHARDAIAIAGAQSNIRELSRIVELSWQKRSANIIELTSKQKLTEFIRN